MNHSPVKVSSNWSHVGGCSLSQCVKELAADPDIFIKPDINKLVDEERSILLSREQSPDYCELYVHKFCQYKIKAVSFVCNVVKVENFHGPIMEYMDTVYGVVVDETEDQFKSYRYDVEILKLGVTDLTLRFLTNSSEVCIFGFILYTSPNPIGITTPSIFSFNGQNVSQTEAKPSKDSEKYDKLLKLSTNAIQNNSLMLGHLFQAQFNIGHDDEPCTTNRKINEDILDKLKLHIDKRFEDITMHVNSKLAEMEQRQNKKLDKLLHILTNNK